MTNSIVANEVSPVNAIANVQQSGIWLLNGAEDELYWRDNHYPSQDVKAPILAACEHVEGTPRFRIRLPERWEHVFFREVLEALEELGSYSLTLNDDPEEYRTLRDLLFAALLPAPQSAWEQRYCEQILAWCCMAVAQSSRDLWPHWAHQISGRLRELGHRVGVTVNQISRLIRAFDNSNRAQLNNPQHAAHAFLRALRGQLPRGERELVAADGEELSEGQMDLAYHLAEFWLYRSNRWQPLSLDAVKQQIVSFLQLEDNGPVITEHFVKDIILNLKPLAAVTLDGTEPMPFRMNRNPGNGETTIEQVNWIRVRNGIVDLEALLVGDTENVLLPHSPEWFNAQPPLDFAYDPTADCPVLRGAVNDWLPVRGENDTRQQLLQQIAGVTLSAGPADRLFCLLGSGRDGKSTFFRVLEDLHGATNCSNVLLEDLNKDAFRVQLHNKVVNFSRDAGHLDKLAEGLIKAFCSGEPVTVNPKYRQPFEMVPPKMLVACNQLPRSSDPTNGFWRRLLVVPFLDPIPEANVNPNLVSDIRGELAGVFNWAVEGLRAYRAAGERFIECPIAEEVRRDHRHSCNPVAQFVEDRCLVGNGEVASQQLYDAYCDYCEVSGYTPKNIANFRGDLKLQLGDRIELPTGVSRRCGIVARWIGGIQLRNERFPEYVAA